MSQKQGVDIHTVAESGMNVNLVSASFYFKLSEHMKLFHAFFLSTAYRFWSYNENEKNVNN